MGLSTDRLTISHVWNSLTATNGIREILTLCSSKLVELDMKNLERETQHQASTMRSHHGHNCCENGASRALLYISSTTRVPSCLEGLEDS